MSDFAIPIRDTFRSMLAHLQRGGNFGYWWVLDEVETFFNKKTEEYEPVKKCYCWPSDAPAPLPRGETEHKYFGVHPISERRDPWQRARNVDVMAINCLFAEFDQPYTNLTPEPSIVIESSKGKYHCYWLLRDTVLLDSDERRQEVAQIQRYWVRRVGADEVKDLARVLRVPGTRNVKAKYAPDFPMVHFVKADLDLQYSFEELAYRVAPAIAADERAKLETALLSKLKRPLRDNDPSASIITRYNQAHDIHSALRSAGYVTSGARYHAPNADRGVPASVVILDDQYSYHWDTGDLLSDEHRHTAFDVFCRYDHSDDVAAAVKAAATELGVSYSEEERREYGRKLHAEALKTAPSKPQVHATIEATETALYNAEAEDATIAAILHEPDSLFRVHWLQASHFYQARNCTLFEALHYCVANSIPTDVISVSDVLLRRGKLEAIGGRETLDRLYAFSATGESIEYHARIIERMAVRRELSKLSQTFAHRVVDDTEDAETTRTWIVQEILKASAANEQVVTDGGSIFDSILDDLGLDEVEEEDEFVTGISDLDRFFHIARQQVITIAGRTGTGKTTLLGHLRWEALQQGYQVLEYSAEMPQKDLALRMVCAQQRVYLSRLKSRKLDTQQRTACQQTTTYLSQQARNNWHVMDRAQSLDTIRLEAMRCKATNNKPLVIILDHLGLIQYPKGLTREYDALSEISRQIKILARELDAIVFLAVQMNREQDKRESADKMPRLSDLRGTGRIEEDSDKVVFLHLSAAEHARRKDAISSGKDTTLELGYVVEKNRQGPTGIAMAYWEIDYYRISDTQHAIPEGY